MPASAMARESREQPEASPAVLVVDDDAAVRRMLRLMLRDEGFEVDVAEGGEEGLKHLEDHPPDAVVLDLEMPEMDGRTFYRELRNRGFDTPVLVVSAYGARAARRELGAEASLDKPFEPEALISAVRELV